MLCTECKIFKDLKYKQTLNCISFQYIKHFQSVFVDIIDSTHYVYFFPYKFKAMQNCLMKIMNIFKFYI